MKNIAWSNSKLIYTCEGITNNMTFTMFNPIKYANNHLSQIFMSTDKLILAVVNICIR